MIEPHIPDNAGVSAQCFGLFKAKDEHNINIITNFRDLNYKSSLN